MAKRREHKPNVKVPGPSGPALFTQRDYDMGLGILEDDDEHADNTLLAPSQRLNIYAPATNFHTTVRVPAPPAYERKFDFSAGETTRKSTPLQLRTDPTQVPRAPRVFYTPAVFDTLWSLISICTQEVGWLGYVEDTPLGDYLITDLYVPAQTVTGTETDIDPSELATLGYELMQAGKDPGKLRYWGHSHVNMGVAPSGQDERQIDEYLVDCPIFIRGIYNKRGEVKVDVFDREKEIVHQCVANRIYSPGLSDEQQVSLVKMLKENVTSRKFTNWIKK